MKPDFIDSVQSTKFIMSSVCLIIAAIAFFVGKIDQQTFWPLMLGILSQYGLFNTVSKFSDTQSAN